MTRRLVLLSTLLVLGGVINFWAAALCALTRREPAYASVVEGSAEARPEQVFEALAFIVPLDSVTRVEAGWPLSVLAGTTARQVEASGFNVIEFRETFENHDLQPVHFELGRWTIDADLPTRPVWTGIVANTLLYSVALWLLPFVPRVLRRAIRARRGLCAQCGYPIGRVDRCSECGASVSPAGGPQQ